MKMRSLKLPCKLPDKSPSASCISAFAVTVSINSVFQGVYFKYFRLCRGECRARSIIKRICTSSDEFYIGIRFLAGSINILIKFVQSCRIVRVK